jgi:transposase
MYFKQKQLDGSYTIFESDLNFDVDIATKLTDAEIQSYLLSKAKELKFAEIKTKRDKALNSNIIFNNQEYKGTENARTLFCTRFNLGIFPIEWRLADDITWVILDKEKSTGLANAFFNNSSVVYQKESSFLTTLNNAITIDNINNIIVNY